MTLSSFFLNYGRPISDITHRLQYDELLRDAQTVLDKLTLIEREVTTTDQQEPVYSSPRES